LLKKTNFEAKINSHFSMGSVKFLEFFPIGLTIKKNCGKNKEHYYRW
jgi:hypothetical protein